MSEVVKAPIQSPEAQKPAQVSRPDKSSVARPRDKITGRIDTDPRITGTKPQTFERGDALEAVYKDIKAEQLRAIESDGRVVSSLSSPDSRDRDDARTQASRDVWGKFAVDNPNLAQKFADRDSSVQQAIDSYVAREAALAMAAAESAAKSIVANEISQGPIGDRTNDQEQAVQVAITRQLENFARNNPDLARLIAEKGVNPRIAEAYTSFTIKEELAKTAVAKRAAEAATASGPEAGLQTIASLPTKEEWQAEFDKANTETAGPKPDKTYQTSEAWTDAYREALGNQPRTPEELKIIRSEAAKKAAATRKANAQANATAAEAAPPPSDYSAKTAEAGPAQPPQPDGASRQEARHAQPTPEARGEIPVEDRLAEAAINLGDAKRAIQEARKNGASGDEINALALKVIEARANLDTVTTERNNAVDQAERARLTAENAALKADNARLNSRISGMEVQLSQILQRLDSGAAVKPDGGTSGTPTEAAPPPPELKPGSPEAMAYQIALMQAEIAQLKDALKLSVKINNEKDPTTRDSMLAQLMAMLAKGVIAAAAVTVPHQD